MAEESLNLSELAAALGCDTDTVRAWHRLGLLVGDGEQSPLEDLERGRLILYAERRGISAEDIAEACRTQGDVLGDFAGMVYGDEPRRGRRREDAVEASGLDPETLRRIWSTSGLGDQDEVYDEDVEALRTIAFVLAAGLPEEALVQLIRVYADALGRVADAETRLFHYYVHERLRSEGLRGKELTAATNAIADPMHELIEPTVLYFHRKALQRALRDDFLLHLTQATTPPGQTVGEMTVTVLFVDLSGFTPLTESMGDAAAAGVVERFSGLVREAAARRDGKVVKQIGDEFMLAFSDPTRAIHFGLALDEAVRAEPQFPGLRIGAHHGSVLYREGDYIGTTVNIAARVTDVATRGEFLITDTLRREARLTSDMSMVSVGRRPLKGISGEVELHRVQFGLRPDRAVDPVCQIVLEAGAALATIHWGGIDVQFCSEDCAQRFQADPERYVNRTGQPARTG